MLNTAIMVPSACDDAVFAGRHLRRVRRRRVQPLMHVKFLGEDLEAQVGALGQSEALVAIWKGLELAGADDSRGADTRRSVRRGAEITVQVMRRAAERDVRNDAFGLAQQGIADTAALLVRASTENMPK
jgi:hypothetical protein